MADRHYYDSKGVYKGRSSSKSPAMAGGQGIVFLFVICVFFARWAAHNFWLFIGICSLAIAALLFLRHAFQNFRFASVGLFIVLIVLTGSGYFEIAQLHQNKVGYAAADKLVKRVIGGK